jgi:hypothetical protein
MLLIIVKDVTKEPLSFIYRGAYPFLISLILCAEVVDIYV